MIIQKKINEIKKKIINKQKWVLYYNRFLKEIKKKIQKSICKIYKKIWLRNKKKTKHVKFCMSKQQQKF